MEERRRSLVSFHERGNVEDQRHPSVAEYTRSRDSIDVAIVISKRFDDELLLPDEAIHDESHGPIVHVDHEDLPPALRRTVFPPCRGCRRGTGGA